MEPEPAPTNGRQRPSNRRQRARRFFAQHRAGSRIALIALLLLAAGALLLWRWLSTFESTDDAQIDGHIAQLSSRVPGTVIAVHVQENDEVQKGQWLVELDARDYQVALARAEADLAQARAQLDAANPNLPITATTTRTEVSTTVAERDNARAVLAQAVRDRDAAEARTREAQANQARAKIDLERYRYLVKENAVPRTQYDEKLASAKATAAALDSARAEARAAKQRIDQAQARVAQAESRAMEAGKNAPHQLEAQRASVSAREAAVKAAEAALERARLDLEYTHVAAPENGVIGRRAAEPGEHVQAGQELLGFVQTQDLWVTANFKETQLRHLQVGQAARVHVDALERDYDGELASFGGASGARFSLLPPENATGNYVKVVQRLPLRVHLQPGQPELARLRPGMSVEAKVYVK